MMAEFGGTNTMEQEPKAQQQQEKPEVKTEQPKPAKKSYTTPTLTRYGGLPEITKAVGNHGANDNGTAPNQKTHP